MKIENYAVMVTRDSPPGTPSADLSTFGDLPIRVYLDIDGAECELTPEQAKNLSVLLSEAALLGDRDEPVCFALLRPAAVLAH